MINVLFFAKLSEMLNTRKILVPINAVEDTEQLMQYLMDKNDEWRDVLVSQTWLIAVNQHMCRENVVLKSGDEVAYFPPVTGG